MTAIKLVNWHYFVNETIRVRGSTLITGDNGSGKSTIFDAIQMALIADQRKVRFNVSAHDQTNRDLKGYLRCRTGRDDASGGDSAQGYLRGGDFTSYIALEFYDTARNDHFVLGLAVDTLAGEPDTPQFFRLSGPLDESLFVQGDSPRSVSDFRAALKQRRGGELFGSVAAYRTALLAQLGHLHERFFSLVIKGLAFHPITNVRQFVYDYVLDPKEVRIDAMLENFRQYRQYDHLVQQTKEKVARLNEIAERYGARVEGERTAGIQQYVVLRAARDRAQEELDQLRASQAEIHRRIAAAEAEQKRLEGQIAALSRDLGDLKDARARNQAFEALQAIERRLEELRGLAAALEVDGQRLTAEARTCSRALATALRLAGEHPGILQLGDPAPLTVLQEAVAAMDVLAGGDIGAPARDLGALTTALESLGDQVVTSEGALKKEREELRTERAELDQTLSELSKRKRRFPAGVQSLRDALAEALPDTEAQVLCELIEVPNEIWQNAVEGYLNTQRFDLFVPGERFDEALAVYERTKYERKIESAGLVNSQALVRSQPQAVPGSLADEVTTEHTAARAYIDRLLGRVMKCASEQELKRYPVAITPTCMTYRNHTARQIEFHVYAVPQIGSRAIARQIELKQQRLKEVSDRLDALVGELAICAEFKGAVRGHEPARMAERWQALGQLPEIRAHIEAKLQERASLDLGELQALQQQIEAKEGALGDAQKRLRAIDKALGDAAAELRQATGLVAQEEQKVRERQDDLEGYVATHPDWAEPGSARYQEALRRNSVQAVEQNFRSNRLGLLTQIENISKELYRLRLEYNGRYQFGGSPDGADNQAYGNELEKLVRSELPAYEERIDQARKAAEEEFKEHFIFKLKENIHLARQEFDNLNRVLKEIEFGQDRYQFTCTADRGHKHFYDMITDEFALEGFNLFSTHFREKFGATMDELFRLILDVPEERQAENIRRYTDYRTYLEFDIRIHHAGGDTSSLSKVAREKSGGETQTPFYVAMVASFLQLYRPRQNQHSIRLLMFDEAFNRMDPDRAENTLQFIRKLGLQVLAAAPTDKCEIITPHVETTLLTLREGHRAWLEDYHQVLGALPAPAGSEVAAAREVGP